jgi:hypothetical protein
MKASGSSVEDAGLRGSGRGVMIEARFSRGAEITPGAHTRTLAALCASSVCTSLEIHCTASRASLRVWAANSSVLELAAHSLRSAWPNVTLERVSDSLPPGRAAAGFECVMRFDPAIPLSPGDTKQVIDTVDGIVSVASEIDADDYVIWQTVLSPITDKRWPRRARALAGRIGAESSSRGDRQIASAIEEKAGHPQALAAIRAVALSADRDRARIIAENLKGSLTFGSHHNGLVAIAPGSAGDFMRRVKARSPGNVPLSAVEVAGLWGPGTGRRPARAVASGPPTLRIETTLPPGVRLGTARGRRGPVEVSLPLNGTMPHVLVVGTTGYGKTTLAENMFVQCVRAGRGAVFIDPKGGSFSRLCALIPEARRRDVQIIDPGGRSSCGFDPIRYARASPHANLFVEHMTATVMHLARDAATGPRQEALTRSCTKVLVEIPETGLEEMLSLLTDADWRRPRLPAVRDVESRRFLEMQLDRQSPAAAQSAAMPVVNAIAPIISNPFMRNLLEAEPQLDVQRLLDEEGILLVNAAEGMLGPQTSKLLTALIPSVLHLAAAGRRGRAAAKRDIVLFIDEFHRLPAAVIAHMLSESRAFGIKLILVTQYLNQVPPDVRSALHGNVGGWLVFRVGSEDAHVLAERLGDGVTPGDLMALDFYRATAKISLPGCMPPAFTLWTDPPLAAPAAALCELDEPLPAIAQVAAATGIPVTASTNGSRRALPDVDED